jgi:hypothetical protein
MKNLKKTILSMSLLMVFLTIFSDANALRHFRIRVDCIGCDMIAECVPHPTNCLDTIVIIMPN